MKFSRPAAVLGAAVVLVGGVTVAVHAATASTDSTRLCIQKNSSTASVYAPAAGVTTCQKGFKLVELASADALTALQTQVEGEIDALQSQVTDLQTENQTQDEQITALDPGELTVSGSYLGGGQFHADVTGSHLRPAVVDITISDSTSLQFGGIVAADGTFSSSISAFGCEHLPMVWHAVTAIGRPIEATLTPAAAGCP